jgi:hypothetical protein
MMACGDESFTSNFSGATVLADFDPALGITRLHLAGMLDDGTAPFKEADFTVPAPPMPPPRTVEDPISITLKDTLDGRKISFQVTGFNMSDAMVATGTCGTTLQKGVLISLHTHVRPQ